MIEEIERRARKLREVGDNDGALALEVLARDIREGLVGDVASA